MNTITIRSVNTQSPFRDKSVKVFEYDPNELLYSDEAQDHIESLLMANHSFSVEFQTQERIDSAQVLNEIIIRVAGYAGASK